MRQTLAVFYFALIINISFGQHLYPEKFDDCHTSQFCVDCGKPKAKAPQNFEKELAENLNLKSLKSINGFIELQVLVDTLGNPCLLSVKNESNAKTVKLNIQQAIQNSSKWTPAISQGKPTRSSVSLKLSFTGGTLSVERKVFDFEKNTNMKSEDAPEIGEPTESDLIALIPPKTFGQEEIPDSILYSLARQSLDNLTLTKVKIFHQVMKPKYLIEKGNRILRDIAHLSDDDLQSIKGQILNPTITNWDNHIFTQESNFDIVNTFKNDGVVFISLPLVSLDKNVIVIYYETWRYKKNKTSGSGTITVWTWSLLNEWINQSQHVIWIEDREVHKKFKETGGSWRKLEN